MRILSASPADRISGYILAPRFFMLFGLSCRLCQAFSRTGTPLCFRCLEQFFRETRRFPPARPASGGFPVRGLFRYEGIAREIFGLAKFQGDRSLADFLIDRGMERMPFPSGVHLWIPVPPDKRRLLLRGFSLPDRMAWRLERLTGIPCTLDGGPPRAQREQKSLDRSGRLARIRHGETFGGAYPSIRMSGVTILDDLVTTGGTIQSFAAFLLSRGARIVQAVALFDAPLRVGEEI